VQPDTQNVNELLVLAARRRNVELLIVRRLIECCDDRSVHLCHWRFQWIWRCQSEGTFPRGPGVG
jgi:hypothetical protein